jgi:amino acid transporter
LALSGSFVALAELSAVSRLATYLGTAAAVPVLRRRFDATREGFRAPGGALIPVAASVLTIGLAASATAGNLIAAAIALTVGWLLYLLRREPADTSSEHHSGRKHSGG